MNIPGKKIIPLAWLLLLICGVLMYCSPYREGQVTEETWTVIRVESISRYDGDGMARFEMVTFREENTKTEFVLYRSKVGSYHMGERFVNLSRK